MTAEAKPKATGGKGRRKDVVQLGSRISPDLMRKMQHVAIEADTSVTVLVNEGLAALFAYRGNCIISVRDGRVVNVRQTKVA